MKEPQRQFCSACGIKLINIHVDCVACGKKQHNLNKPTIKDWAEVYWVYAWVVIGIVIIKAITMLDPSLNSDTNKMWEAGNNYKLDVIVSCQNAAKGKLNKPNDTTFGKSYPQFHINKIDSSKFQYLITDTFTSSNSYGVSLAGSYYCEASANIMDGAIRVNKISLNKKHELQKI